MNAHMKARRHWWLERMSSAALIPLSLWWVHALATTELTEIVALSQWLQEWGNAVLLALFLTVALYHSKLGLEVIVDDYISDAGWNARTHLLCKLILLLALVVAFAGIIYFAA